MIPDSLAPGFVIQAPDKTSSRESGDEASHHPRQALTMCAKETTSGVSHFFSVANCVPDLNRPSFHVQAPPPLRSSRAR